MARRSIPEKTKKRVFQEAGMHCPLCGEDDVVTFEIHHIQPVCEIENNKEENLILLCGNCHAKVTSEEVDECELLRLKITLMSKSKKYQKDNNKRWPAEKTLFQLSDEQIGKIRHVKWCALSNIEKKYFYDEYLKLDPKAHSRNYRAASVKRQNELQSLHKIDVNVLNDFLDSLGIPVVPQLPMTDDEKDKLQRRYHSIIEAVINISVDGFDKKQTECFIRMYNYLSCADIAPSQAELRKVDACIVPGARWSLQQRSDEAIKLHKVTGCKLILVGGYPIYDKGKANVISESEAMLYYITNKPNITLNSESIFIENRSTSSIESLNNIIPLLNEISIDTDRPIIIGAISGFRKKIYANNPLI